MFVDVYVDILPGTTRRKETLFMNMGKTVLAQRILINYCREHGYTDMKFIGVDCVSAVDQVGTTRRLGVNLFGEVLDLDRRQAVGE